MSERTAMEALRSALRFAASRSAITSAEELAIMAAWNTRTPPAADAEPVAWLYTYTVQYKPKLECTKKLAPVIRLSLSRWENVHEPWTETPLYTADQLQAYGDARARESLEQFEHPDFAPLTNSALRARIEALEALVKEAGEALEGTYIPS